jgi:glycerophosphoryl diester phosphodiesterase
MQEWLKRNRDQYIFAYPRTCAHGGFAQILPEHTMPAWGAAVSMGAEEIEFDLWHTKDGELVSIHDCTLDRTSDGTGYVFDHTLEELRQLDFGSKHSEALKGLRNSTFEEILKEFAGRVIMNIHVKSLYEYIPYGYTGDPAYDPGHMEKIIALIDKYDCREYVYFMSCVEVLEIARLLAPGIRRCCGEEEDVYWGRKKTQIVQRAIAHDCQMVQFRCGPDHKPCFTKEDVELAHANNMICNVCEPHTAEEARILLEMGADTLLAVNYLAVAQMVQTFKKKSV